MPDTLTASVPAADTTPAGQTMETPTISFGRSQPLAFKSRLERPNDKNYLAYRKQKKMELLRYSEFELKEMLDIQQKRQAPKDESGGELTREIISGLYSQQMPETVQKNILGSASGSGLADGSALIRQDLEVIIDALYVRIYPLYEAIKKVPSNGLGKLAPAA